MKIEYDKEADAAYIYLSRQQVDHTLNVTDSINLDIDSSGNLIGIEILNASIQIPKKTLDTSIRIDIPAFA
jgi:uncharacterized protein YuzE